MSVQPLTHLRIKNPATRPWPQINDAGMSEMAALLDDAPLPQILVTHVSHAGAQPQIPHGVG